MPIISFPTIKRVLYYHHYQPTRILLNKGISFKMPQQCKSPFASTGALNSQAGCCQDI